MSYRVYFNGVDSAGRSQLWATDGTATNTFEIVPTGYTTGLQPQGITALSGTTLFNGLDSTGAARLWATDGTAAGTVALTVAGANAAGLAPADITRFGTGALFEGTDSAGNLQLWVTDGTGAGTTELSGSLGPSGGVDPVSITVVNAGVAVFNGLDANGAPQLFVTNGKAAGTQILTVAGANGAGLNPIDLTAFNNGALFFGLDQTGGQGLWFTTGTAGGTTELAPEPGADATGFTVLGNQALFEDGNNALAVTNGQASGTQELAVTGAAAAGLQPTDITSFGSKVLFAGVDQTNAASLWISDGTASGTTEVARFSATGSIADITLFGAKALFSGTDAAGNPQLWITDGTNAGTTEILPVGAYAGGLAPAAITTIGSQALFSGLDTAGNLQLWSTTGTASGTTVVAAGNSNAFGLSPSDLTLAPTPASLVISTPQAATIGVGRAGAIKPVSISETGVAAGEIVTVTLTDPNGVLSAPGGTASAGGTVLTVTGTVAQVNAALTGLTDTEGTAGTGAITINSVDRDGTHASTAKIALTVNGAPTISAPTMATVAAGPATPISPVSIAESGNTSGEAFTVTLSDTYGRLSATGTGITGSGTTNLVITGSLAQVNADLSTLRDTDTVTAPDTISFGVVDGFGNAASAKTAINVAGRPVIAAPGSVATGIGQSKPIAGVSLSETNSFAGETFTATLGDTNGTLTATGVGVLGSGTKNLVITGSLAQVNADLATLGYVSNTAGPDTLTINASDSLLDSATPASVAVSVSGAPVIAAPSSVTVNQNYPSAIRGISVSEAYASMGETFTTVLHDGAGLLAATGATGSGSATLQITGSLAQINAALATLTDTDASTAADSLSITTTDNFGNSSSTSVPVSVTPIMPSTINGTVAGQVTTDEQSTKPFAKVQIADPNPGQTTETITITPSTLANGALFDPNAPTDGSSITQGVYRISGTPAAVTAAIDTLVFVPTVHEVTPGASVTTGLTISDTNSVGLTSADSSTTVKAVAVNDAPTITGAKSGQTGIDYVVLSPFATVTIADPDVNVTDGLTIILRNASGTATDANGTLTGAGLTKTGTGTYTLTPAAPAALTASLQKLSFIPTQHQTSPGQTTTTTFVLTATQTAGGTTVSTTNAATTVTETALNYITGPSFGFSLIIGTQGSDVIIAQGSFNTILSNGGNDYIIAGAGHANVNACNGTDVITLAGSNNAVNGQDGNNTVTGGSGGNNFITLGDGVDVISVGGTNDTINLGDGGDTVSGTQGSAIITTGSGNDTIVVGGAGNVIDAGGGTNSITGGTGNDTFLLPGANEGFDVIRNFTLTNGDVLNLAAALHETSWNQQASTLGNYLKVTSGAGNTTLSIAPSGSGGGTAVAQLAGAGTLTLQDLVSHGSLHTSLFGF